jgi:hypothetical protein
MKAIAKKNPPIDKSGANRAVAAEARTSSVASTRLHHSENTALQLKPVCPCDGDCPRCIGNTAVQAKLKIGQPDDTYEQEADRVADQVMQMPEPDVRRKPGWLFANGPSWGDESPEEGLIQRTFATGQITPSVENQRSGQQVIQRQEANPEVLASPDLEAANRIAEEFLVIAENATSVDGFKSEVESKADGDLGFLGADVVVFSLSCAAGYWIGVGGGLEALYSPRFGWATFAQFGGGAVSPGAGCALEVGIIWDLKNPKDYTELFIEGAITGGPGFIGYWPGMVSASGSITPGDVAELVTSGTASRPRGIKVGGGYGTPGIQGSALLEWYWLLTGSEPTSDVSSEEGTSTESETTPTEQPGEAKAELQPVPISQIETTVEVFVDILSDADREGYRRVHFTIHRTTSEIVPGFEKSRKAESLSPAGHRAESELRALVEIVARQQAGRSVIIADRHSSGWSLSFRAPNE